MEVTTYGFKIPNCLCEWSTCAADDSASSEDSLNSWKPFLSNTFRMQSSMRKQSENHSVINHKFHTIKWLPHFSPWLFVSKIQSTDTSDASNTLFGFMFRSKKTALFIEFFLHLDFISSFQFSNSGTFGLTHTFSDRKTLIIYYGFSFCFAEHHKKGTCCFSVNLHENNFFTAMLNQNIRLFIWFVNKSFMKIIGKLYLEQGSVGIKTKFEL